MTPEEAEKRAIQQFWNSQPEPLWVDEMHLFHYEDMAKNDFKEERLDGFDMQFLTWRTLYDIRNALLMIHDELRDLRKGNNQ